MERVAPGPITRATPGLDDVLLPWNHKVSTPLSRAGAWMTVSITSPFSEVGGTGLEPVTPSLSSRSRR